jgi:uncharacterized repeat protein (TIGR02543 family)
MDQNRGITATFTLGYDLTVTVGGSGGGTVTSNPPGINCSFGTCTKKYAENTSVILTASPDANSVFSGWSVACLGTNPSCTVTMNGPKSVTATFTAGYDLNVSLGGTGGGSITSNPSGIACPDDCSEKYAENSSVILAATPNASSVFTSWAGCNVVNENQCTVTMTGAKSVVATFTTGYDLTVTVIGIIGTVTSNPPGITCFSGSTCTKKYAAGTDVTLTAAGGAFLGWSGDVCNGSPLPTCGPFTMNGPKNVTATFA